MAKVPFTSHDDANLTHTFASAGTYTVEIYPVFGGVYFNNAGDRLKLTSFVTLGDTVPEFLGGAFDGCENMTSCNLDTVEDMSHINSLYKTFNGCSSLIASPDVSGLTGVTTLYKAWNGCSDLTSSSSVSALTNVISLSFTWFGCSSLASLPSVNTLTSVTDLSYAWGYCSSANSAPDVNSLTGVTNLTYTWGYCSGLTTAPAVSALINVTSLNKTWRDCPNLTTAPDISTLVNVTDMSLTWLNCSSLTTITLPTDLSGITTMESMLVGVTLNTAGVGGIDWIIGELHDAMVAGKSWNGILIHLGNGKYSASVLTEFNALVADGAIITSGGQV